MNQLNPRTVAECGEDMAQALGLVWADDRKEVVRFLNLYRNLLYNRYKDVKLFDSVFHCICLQCFEEPCNDPCTPCDDKYCGVTLPNDVAGVVSAWRYTGPARLHSRWRESMTERVTSHSGGELRLVEMGQTFPTERDIVGGPVVLKMFTEDWEDSGKDAYLTVIDAEKKTKRIKMSLKYDKWVTAPVDVLSIVSVSLPQLCGCVTLAQSCGRELSIYCPDDRTPSYRRVKIAGTCECKGRILIQGTRRFTKLWFDTDIVEVGDMIMLDYAGTYFKYWKSKDRDEKDTANNALAGLFANLDGIVARYRGQMTQDGPVIFQRVSRTGLLYSRKR